MVLKCKNRLLDLSCPVVMGILNLTPDSFYDGGKFRDLEVILDQAGKMVEEGARIIDIGGMSSRPGAEVVTPVEELHRILPATKAIRNKFPDIFISIDTVHSQTARETLEEGVDIINDISGYSIDKKIIEEVAEFNAGYILMHMQNIPKHMQDDPVYSDIVSDIMRFFLNKMEDLKERGVENVVLDPGFGFGKTIDHNYKLLENFSVFRILECPLLAGISRKSMLYKYLDIRAQDALPATAIANYISLCQGAKILRVHDVSEAVQAIKIYQKCNLGK